MTKPSEIILMDEWTDLSPKELQDALNHVNLSKFDKPQMKLKRMKIGYEWLMCLVLEDKGINNG